MPPKAVIRPWTQEEDRLLVQAMAQHGNFESWKDIANVVPGRTNKACRKVQLIYSHWRRPFYTQTRTSSGGCIPCVRPSKSRAGRQRRITSSLSYTGSTRTSGPPSPVSSRAAPTTPVPNAFGRRSIPDSRKTSGRPRRTPSCSMPRSAWAASGKRLVRKCSAAVWHAGIGDYRSTSSS